MERTTDMAWRVIMLLVGLASAGLANELVVLEVPKGGKPEDVRSWKSGSSFADGAALDNGQVLLMAIPGAQGMALVSGRNPAVSLNIRAVSENGTNPKIVKVTVERKDETEAVLNVALEGGLPVNVRMSQGTLHVEIAGGRGVQGVDVCGRFKNTVLPDFFGFDAVFAPQRYKSDRLAVPAENFLLNLMEGGDGIAMCAWQGTLSLGSEKDRAVRDPKVELFLSGVGAGRRIEASRIEFAGKPVYVAVLAGKSIWHEEDVSGWEAQKPTELNWKPPFEAVWRASFLAREGLMCRDLLSSCLSYDGFYRDAGYRWVGETPTMSIQGLWPYFICSFWINRDKPYVALYADMNDRKATERRNNDEKNAARKENRAPVVFYPTNVFEKALIYPMNRRKDTPITESVPTDIMRACLGQGPCEYVLDLEGVKGRPSGGSRETQATCGNWDNNISHFVNAARGKDTSFVLNGKKLTGLRNGEKFPPEFEERLVMNLEDMVLFVSAVNKRLQEYQSFDTNLIAFCMQEMGRSGNVKPVAGRILTLAQGLQGGNGVSAQRMAGFNKQRDEWDGRVKAMIADVKAGKYDTFAKVGDIRDQYAEPQDITVSVCRRFAKSIRLEASTTDSSDPEVLKFTSAVRDMCHRILRNKHQMEGS